MPIATKKVISYLKNENKKLWEKHLKESSYENNLRIQSEIFEKCNWEGFNLSNVTFDKCTFKKCNLKRTNLEKSRFSECLIENCIFDHCKTGKINEHNATVFNGGLKEKSTISNTVFRHADLKNIYFQEYRVENCSFVNANLSNTQFSRVSLYDCNFKNSNFRWTIFNNHTTWEKCIINKKTNFEYAKFNTDTHYPIDNDKSDKIKISKWDIPSWNHINFLSDIPIFQASFAIFVLSLFIANIITTINATEYLNIIKTYPIPMPRQLSFVLISSFLLFLGSLFYRFGCPHEIQNFTVSEWVVEHKKARLLYVQKTLHNWWLKTICMLCLITGGGIGLWLISCRVLDIFLSIDHNCLYCH